uniref:MD-2-related lipid-recognition domain-containing protein n=1 Tax=Timema poppense TaxID=170557 RepID=A0A7R9H515_TIMPO|nr:unnamed protein product [Timema poppensis]
MWYVTSLLLLIALASEVLAGTPVKSCKDAPPITESNAVTISGCDEAPCKLEKKSSTDLHFKFKVDKETETVTNKVSAKIGPMDMPFIGVDGTDACSLIFLGDGSPASCPLKEGVEYVYRNSISVSEMYPKALEENIIPRDIPRAFLLLKEMNESVQQVTQLVDNMLARVKRGEVSTNKGLSFLEVKYHMLLSYLINLTYVVLIKCSGEKIEDDPTIDCLVEIRTVLEKMRLIDHKLKYLIDKFVKTAITCSTNSQDPSNVRANPANMISKLDEEEVSESGSEQEEQSRVTQFDTS